MKNLKYKILNQLHVLNHNCIDQESVVKYDVMEISVSISRIFVNNSNLNTSFGSFHLSTFIDEDGKQKGIIAPRETWFIGGAIYNIIAEHL